MNAKSKLSRLQCKDVKINKGEKISTNSTESEKSKHEIESKKITSTNTTPVSRKNVAKEDIEDERLSPFFMRFTQDSGDDDLDVIWDWDSPRSKGSRILNRKRIIHSSPNIPKKQISYNLPRFNSLKAELEELANKLHNQESVTSESQSVTSENQSCLVIDEPNVFVKPKTPVVLSPETIDTSDPFNDDSLDEEMIKCSQQVEEAFNLNQWCTSIVTTNNNKDFPKQFLPDTTIKDDSFDVLLEEIKDEDIELLSQASGSSGSTQPLIIENPRTIFNNVASPRSIARTNSVPTEFLTKVTKPPTSTININSFPRTKSEDMFNKSLKKTEVIIKCSPEEIEKKRQEAKAKLEYKKKQYEIEKKRQEAMEKLKRNRMQRMLGIQKNSLPR